MKEINLRDYYPFYTDDVHIEVPDEVAELLHTSKLNEAAYRLRTYRHKAYFSLDLGDGIEADATITPPSPFEVLERQRMMELVYVGLASLSEKQRWRLYAHYFLGMSKAAIARTEGSGVTSVKESIQRGLRSLEKFFEKNL